MRVKPRILFMVLPFVCATGCLRTEFVFPSLTSIGGSPQTCTITDANLVAPNIRSGITIHSVVGTYTPAYVESDFLANLNRSKGSPQTSWLADTISTTAYPNSNSGTRVITSYASDTEGKWNVAELVNRTGWSTRVCGDTGLTLDARIADCATEFGADATWNGATKGISGEATWKLVSRMGDQVSSHGREVWQDQRTKLLWSSIIGKNVNWCKAAGKSNIGSNPAAEADLDNICDNASNQATSGPAISACFEDDGTHFTQVDAISSSIFNPDGKAGLGFSTTPAVHWRLPSRSDYYQAEVDGIRYVLPDMMSTAVEWTTMVNTLPTNEAYTFHGETGTVVPYNRSSGRAVRCVGR